MMGGAHPQEGDDGAPGDGLQQPRGPGRLCRPAPQVEKKEPMTMTQGDGQPACQ